MKKITFLVYIFVIIVSLAKGEETGRHFMTFYTSEQTGGHFQNWAFIQDNRGVMYVGNGYGIQEFDGSTWRLIPISNGSFAFSFAKDSTGRIYVGSAAELGYLAPDSLGAMQYVSLLDQIPVEDRGFTYIWKVIALKEGIFFQARERMFRFTWIPGKDGKTGSWKVKIWRPENTSTYFHYSAYAGNTLFIHHPKNGLMKMVGDTLQPIPGGNKLAYARVRYVLPFPGQPGKYLVCTQQDGFLVFDGKTFQPFPTQADDYIRGVLADVKILPDSTFAVSSNANGFFILDTRGKIKMHLTTSTGLLSNVIIGLYLDRQGNIWMAMNGCVAMLEYKNNMTFFPLAGSGVTDITRFKGIIYAATGTGIYYLDSKESEFKPVTGVPRNQFNFFTFAGGRLYSCTNGGIYNIQGTVGRNMLEISGIPLSFTLIFPMNSDSMHYLAGSMSGIQLLRKDPSSQKFITDKVYSDIYEYVSIIRESEPGVFWIGTWDAGVIRMRFENENYENPKIDKFGPAQGLPPGTVMVNLVNGKLIFSTNKGFYRFVPGQNRFEPDPFFSELKWGVNPSEFPVISDPNGNIWANSGKELAFYRHLPDGKYKKEKGSYSRFEGQMINYLYPEADGTTWFGLATSVVCYKPSSDITNPKPWNTIIHSVKTSGDKIIYSEGDEPSKPGSKRLNIPYSSNDLTFEYSGLSYIKPDYNEFNIRLKGYHRNWTRWSKDTKHNYTNLQPGYYTFVVTARNIIGQQGSEASFSFHILPPWYRTWLAFLGYLIIAVLAVYGLVVSRTRKLKERSRFLEKIVQERTAQIQEQKNNVEQLSKIGKDITSSLSIENIIRTVYENVNNLMDASVFTIGLHKPEEECLEFPAAIEKNQLLPRFSIPLTDENRLAIWCFKNRREVKINDYALEYGEYVGEMAKPIAGESPESILYLPLWNKDKVIGVISAQSFSKNAYSDYHLNMLRNLATYSAIAMENADAYRHLAILLDELRAAQDRLVTQSKLAALGELTAGIAHEIQNPLNFVNNFSEISSELMDELKSELEDGNHVDANNLIHDIKQNLDKINYHGKRADSIVKSMLQHSLGSTGQKKLTDINNLSDEFLRLAYHGLRAKDKSFQASMKTNFDNTLEKVNVVSQDIGRVVLNLINNAFYAVSERKKLNQPDYEPTVWVSTAPLGPPTGGIKGVVIIVKDNGIGIPQKILDKIFQPFFTTKPAGEGTGLGLSLAYDIVTKGHGGELRVETKEGEGTSFIVQLPV
jgi:signal transduction histidine kinase